MVCIVFLVVSVFVGCFPSFFRNGIGWARHDTFQSRKNTSFYS
ncbi:hypothetical protein EVA_03762 [gut metagenome]|uniref:Uncharacterized protein n=1 Tax=gut metagenome TaxID=749906 RepID=J9H3C2_9ZZZZ